MASPVMLFVLAVQVLSFVALGIWFLEHGDWRLGAAQLLLSLVQATIYSKGLV